MKTTINNQNFDLDGRWFFIRTEWRAPGEWRTGMHMSFTGSNVCLYPKDNYTDLTPWWLQAVPGKSNQFYIRNMWKSPTESRVRDHLSFTGDNVCLYDKDNTNDLVPWEFTPVPGNSDCFYIRSMWKAPGESRVGKHISFTGTNVCLYPKDNTYDLVPWRFTPARLKASEVTSIIHQDLAGRLHPNVSIRLSDAHFYPPTLNHARAIIEQSSVDRYTWQSNRFDCDDFAIVLKADFAKDAAAHSEYTGAHAFGILWGSVPQGGHAINWMIDDELKVQFIEPQTDRIFAPGGAGFQNIYFMNS